MAENKYSSPVVCGECKHNWAFNRNDEDKHKMLCFLCQKSQKQALAKHKEIDPCTEKVSKTHAVQQQIETSDSHNEENKQENKPKYIEKINNKDINLSEKEPNSIESYKDKILQSVNNDSSDCEDDLEDIFNTVVAGLDAAEENDYESQIKFPDEKIKGYLSYTVIQSEKDTKIQDTVMTIENQSFADKIRKSNKNVLTASEVSEPLSDDISHRNNDLKVQTSKSDIDSDTEIGEYIEVVSNNLSVSVVGECLSDDISNRNNDLNFDARKLDIVSGTEIQDNLEDTRDNMSVSDMGECLSDELEATDYLFDFFEADIGAVDIETTVTKTDDNKEIKSNNVHEEFSLHHFNYELQKAGIIINNKLMPVNTLTIGHVLGVFVLGRFPEKLIYEWIITSMGKKSPVCVGQMKRISHYLLCEVPSELTEEWKKSLNERFQSAKKCIFRNETEKYRYLCDNISRTKHNSEYIPNECKYFISGNCEKNDCQNHHICSKNEDCISFPKGGKNKFNHVVIFADKVYKPFLQHMEFKNDYQK
ncbi:unnamed protein product, partial [Meganyctiphanes norvegica]